MQRTSIWMLGVLLLTSSIILSASALTPPAAIAGPSVTWPQISLQNVAGGFELPVGITHAGDGSGRLFVLEQAGRIRLLKDGAAVDPPFLDIVERVGFPGGLYSEEGLLGLAFPPGFGDYKDHFYVYYTTNDGNNQLSRFRLASVPDIADPNSEEKILFLEHTYSNGHNGGQLAFGPDGYLYIGTGDGGGAYDPRDNAEKLSALLGKILRIDVEAIKAPPISGGFQVFLPLFGKNSAAPYQPAAYSIPVDNPFAGQPGARGEIWAFGLRNPWRFSFDRVTGDLYISDVGEDDYEEVNFQPASSTGGEHYGWNTMEGDHCVEEPCNKDAYTRPVAEYPHTNDPNRCSVVGGFVYRGPDFPDVQGIYFYVDYCSGEMWGLQHDGAGWQVQEMLDASQNFTSFGEDQAGELYLVDHHAGTVFRLISP